MSNTLTRVQYVFRGIALIGKPVHWMAIHLLGLCDDKFATCSMNVDVLGLPQ